jgi:phosphohistidine phosphatase
MKLYFLRHGIADWPDWDPARDSERPLTDEGLRKMKAEAEAIDRLNLKLSAVLSSPYTRAQQTAESVAQRLGLNVIEEPALAAGFNIGDLPDLLQRYAQAQSLMLVGHEPDFSLIIGQLIGGGRVVMKKGSLARVDLQAIMPPRGELVWLLAPKVLLAA